MKADNLKKEIMSILGDVNFEGHFDNIIENMNENQIDNFMEWIRRCKNGEERISQSKKDKELLAFFFKPNINNVRGILTKKKASFFITLFLDTRKREAFSVQKIIYNFLANTNIMTEKEKN